MKQGTIKKEQWEALNLNRRDLERRKYLTRDIDNNDWWFAILREEGKRLDLVHEGIDGSQDFDGIIFDRVRVDIRLTHLSIDGAEERDFFFSSAMPLNFNFDFDNGGFIRDADEHDDEFDLNAIEYRSHKTQRSADSTYSNCH